MLVPVIEGANAFSQVRSRRGVVLLKRSCAALPLPLPYLSEERGRSSSGLWRPPANFDLNWRDVILFQECFHGDNGAGLGASRQTRMDRDGCSLDHLFATSSAGLYLQLDTVEGIVEVDPASQCGAVE